MLAFASPSSSQNEIVANAAEVADHGVPGRPQHLSLARQTLPTPALYRIEVPGGVDADSAAPDVAAWLSAALRGSQYGIVVFSSPEQAMALTLLAKQDAGAKVLPVEAAPPCLECDRSLLTMLFTDIVDSTRTAERLGDEAWHALLAEHHAIVRKQLTVFRGREVDTAGDGFFATFDRPGRAVCCAEAIRIGLEEIGIAVRAGIHTGECQTIGGQVTGVAVHIAARVASIAQAGEILVSSSLRDLLAGSGLEFSDHGWHMLKGLSGTRQLFAVNRETVALYPGAKKPAKGVRPSTAEIFE